MMQARQVSDSAGCCHQTIKTSGPSQRSEIRLALPAAALFALDALRHAGLPAGRDAVLVWGEELARVSEEVSAAHETRVGYIAFRLVPCKVRVS